MNKDLTRVVVILDRSGSMDSIKEATESGFNEFIGTLKKQPGECRVKLVQFDDQYEEVYDKPVGEVPPLTLVPRNMTALYDAQGKTINNLGSELENTPEDQRPGLVIVMTMTDGLENASREFKAAQIAAMVKHQSEVYSWQFSYLGANQNAQVEAAKMGISAQNAMNYATSHAGVGNTYKVMGNKMNATRRMRSMGATGQALSRAMAFDVGDREEALQEDKK